MLKASVDDVRITLVDSYLGFCEMSRLCGDSDDLLHALAKTGFLEQKYGHTKDSQSIYSAVLAQRAELLWKRRETVEAIQTLRSIVNGKESYTVSSDLVPMEIVLAKLVIPFNRIYRLIKNRHHGPPR